jgi:TRAP transporter TAXI family solute receptor
MIRWFFYAGVFLISAFFPASLVIAGLPTEEFVIGTGTQGGTYHRAGLAIATQVDVRTDAPFGLIARPTTGSIENLHLLETGEISFAIVQERVLNALKSGELGDVGFRGDSLRSIGWLWQNVEHFLVTNALYGTGDLTDLEDIQGHGIYIGATDSGALYSTSFIFAKLGFDLPDALTLSGGYDAVVDAFIAGEVDFASLPGGVPVSTVSRAFSVLGADLHLLNVTEEQAKMIGEPWVQVEIPAGTYPFQRDAVTTVAQPNVLVVQEGVSEDVVYTVARAVFGACESLSAVHPAFAELTNKLKKHAKVWPELHSGAARYFQEIGRSGLSEDCE